MRGLLLPTSLALLLALPLLWRAGEEAALPMPGSEQADQLDWHRVSVTFEPAGETAPPAIEPEIDRRDVLKAGASDPEAPRRDSAD